MTTLKVNQVNESNILSCEPALAGRALHRSDTINESRQAMYNKALDKEFGKTNKRNPKGGIFAALLQIKVEEREVWKAETKTERGQVAEFNKNNPDNKKKMPKYQGFHILSTELYRWMKSRGIEGRASVKTTGEVSLAIVKGKEQPKTGAKTPAAKPEKESGKSGTEVKATLESLMVANDWAVSDVFVELSKIVGGNVLISEMQIALENHANK